MAGEPRERGERCTKKPRPGRARRGRRLLEAEVLSLQHRSQVSLAGAAYRELTRGLQAWQGLAPVQTASADLPVRI
jgi:hypothetical protein